MQRKPRNLDQASRSLLKAVNSDRKPARPDRSADTSNVTRIQNTSLRAGDHGQDFILMDSHGRPARLESFLEEGLVVIHFYRGGWCPYCNSKLRAFQRVLPTIGSLGASLLAISPELPCNSLATEQKNRLTFSVLSDVGNVVAKRFGIVSKLPEELVALYEESQHGFEQANGSNGANELPVPATFVIDQARTISMALVEEGAATHAASALAVKALKKPNG